MGLLAVGGGQGSLILGPALLVVKALCRASAKADGLQSYKSSSRPGNADPGLEATAMTRSASTSYPINGRSAELSGVRTTGHVVVGSDLAGAGQPGRYPASKIQSG
jgi:hypothetical protein